MYISSNNPRGRICLREFDSKVPRNTNYAKNRYDTIEINSLKQIQPQGSVFDNSWLHGVVRMSAFEYKM